MEGVTGPSVREQGGEVKGAPFCALLLPPGVG